MHKTVLLQEAIDNLELGKGNIFVDGTLGAGGHTEEVCRRLGKAVKIIAMDVDAEALERAKERLAGTPCDITYVEDNFRNLDAVMKDSGVQHIDRILLDLGWSSDQFESSGRGFSFRKDEPLRMTLKATLSPEEFDAADIVGKWDEEDIANVLYAYGEERFARRIAREIVEVRDKTPIKTTGDLAKIIESAVPAFYRKGRLHPATKTFQALRIAVNDELESLRQALVKGFAALAPDGRMAIITFHSLEDRIVKNFFKTFERDGIGILINKKPIIPGDEELANNPRARSAKLRIIQKI